MHSPAAAPEREPGVIPRQILACLGIDNASEFT